MIQRIIITGGPATGKSSIITHLQQLGYNCFEEVSREIIQEQKVNTAYKDFDFEAAVFNRRKEQFEHATGLHFYDRSMIDGIAYMRKNKVAVSREMLQTIEQCPYQKIAFIAPPWESVYHKDAERLEDFKEAEGIYQSLQEAYQSFGYQLIEIPLNTVEERVKFIQSQGNLPKI